MFKKVISGILSLAMCSSLAVSLKTSNETTNSNNTQNKNKSDYELSGSNSLGNYLTKLSNQNPQEPAVKTETSLFSVTALEFDAETGDVHICSTQTKDCNVTVAIADEFTGEIVKTAVFPVESGEFVVTDETIDTSSLPKYFIVKAFLSDKIGGKISNEYVFTKYTKDMQEILEADIHDFNEEQVINFDENEDTNFIVLSDDTVISESTEDENVLVTADYDSNVFSFENADENIRSMEFGQYLYIQPNETDIIAVAVDSVETDGDITTVKGSDEPIDDMFDFIKIEQNELGSTMTVDTTNMDESLTYVGHEDEDVFETDGGIEFNVVKKRYNTEFGITKTKTFAVTHDEIMKLTGNEKLANMLKGSIEIYANLYFYKHKDHKEYELKVVPRIKLSIKYTTPDPLKQKENVVFDEMGQYVEEKEVPPAISFGHYAVPTNIPGIAIGFDPRIEISLSATIDCSISIKHTFGTKYNSDYEFNPGSKHPNSDSLSDIEESPTCKATVLEGGLSIRLILDPKVILIKKELANICLKISAGVDFTLGNKDSAGHIMNCIPWKDYPSNSDNTVFAYKSESDSVHGCDFCIIGKIDFVAEVSFDAEVLGKKVLSLTLPKFTMPILETYYSNITGFHVGKTLLDGKKAAMCDNQKYKASFTVLDSKTLTPLPNFTIDFDGLQIKTDDNGSAYVFCNNGSHPYTLTYNSFKSTGKITITNAANNTTIKIKSVTDKNGNTTYSNAGSSNTTGMIHTTVKYTTTTRTTTTTTDPLIPKYDMIKSGPLSDHIGYSVYSNGYMHIFGYGDMDDALTAKALNDVRDQVKEVVFEPCVLYQADPDTGADTTPTVAESDIKITSIGNSLFSGCSNLTTIEIPDTVTRIGSGAFRYCTSLKTLKIPESVTIIDTAAFYGCKNIQFGDLKLHDGITDIGSSVFWDCQGLTSLVIPDSVQNIGGSIVAFCCNLKKVTIPFVGTNRDLNDTQGILLDKLCYVISINDLPENSLTKTYKDRLVTHSYRRVGASLDVSAWIPNSLKTVVITGDDNIPRNAFMGSFLNEIILEDGITTIDLQAFNCSDVIIHIPESVTTIAKNAFNKCKNITIYGKKGSLAETIANENKFLFVDTSNNTTTASTTKTTSKATQTTKATTTTTAKPADILYGDANCNGKVDISDAVLIMQSLSNPSKYGPAGSDPTHITKAGQINADVNETGNGVTNKDALSIQRYALQLIDKLPE